MDGVILILLPAIALTLCFHLVLRLFAAITGLSAESVKKAQSIFGWVIFSIPVLFFSLLTILA